MDCGDSPWFVYTFESQQINCLRSAATGKVVQGAADDIRRVIYSFAISRHPKPETAGLIYPWIVRRHLKTVSFSCASSALSSALSSLLLISLHLSVSACLFFFISFVCLCLFFVSFACLFFVSFVCLFGCLFGCLFVSSSLSLAVSLSLILPLCLPASSSPLV